MLKEIKKGGTIISIAKRMNKSKNTINTQKATIIEKIDNLELDEYKNLTPNSKLRKLSENYFN